MTPTERRVMAGLTDSLRRRMTRRRLDVMHWPEPICNVGAWRSGGPGPCSPKCAEDRQRIAAAEALLAESAPLQIVQASFSDDGAVGRRAAG